MENFTKKATYIFKIFLHMCKCTHTRGSTHSVFTVILLGKAWLVGQLSPRLPFSIYS